MVKLLRCTLAGWDKQARDQGLVTLCYPYTDTIIICSSCTNGNGFLINRQKKVIMNVTVIVTLYCATDTYHMISKVALRIAVASLPYSIISE
jgi:hypothetical protein